MNATRVPYLSAQMIKSGMPVAVFFTGIIFGTERFRWVLLANICLVTTGVSISGQTGHLEQPDPSKIASRQPPTTNHQPPTTNHHNRSLR